LKYFGRVWDNMVMIHTA